MEYNDFPRWNQLVSDFLSGKTTKQPASKESGNADSVKGKKETVKNGKE